MCVLVRDSTVYFFMYVLIFRSIGVARGLCLFRNLLATIFLMIGVWGIPGNVRRGPVPFSSSRSVFADVLLRGVVDILRHHLHIHVKRMVSLADTVVARADDPE